MRAAALKRGKEKKIGAGKLNGEVHRRFVSYGRKVAYFPHSTVAAHNSFWIRNDVFFFALFTDVCRDAANASNRHITPPSSISSPRKGSY